MDGWLPETELCVETRAVLPRFSLAVCEPLPTQTRLCAAPRGQRARRLVWKLGFLEGLLFTTITRNEVVYLLSSRSN